MSIHTICCILFDSAEAEHLIDQACTLALGHDAHLVAVHPYTPVIYFSGIGAEPMVFASIQDWEQAESDRIQERFEDALRRNGLNGEFRRQSTLYASEAFVLSSARGADLVLMGGNGASSRSPDDQAMAERVIRNLGRPVLVMPPGARLGGPAQRLVVGWSDTREATRAAHDALDIAAPGATVDLVSLLSRPGDNPPGLDSRDDFAAALDRRGFRAVTSDRLSTATSRGEDLLQVAQEKNADLLVTGAFGHSQVYDFVIGAVTRHLLQHATLPVLLSK